jgi:hypothetical protein
MYITQRNPSEKSAKGNWYIISRFEKGKQEICHNVGFAHCRVHTIYDDVE